VNQGGIFDPWKSHTNAPSFFACLDILSATDKMEEEHGLQKVIEAYDKVYDA
jgi:hypothetical protein